MLVVKVHQRHPLPTSGSLVVVQVVVEVLNKIRILVEEMLIQILHLMGKQAPVEVVVVEVLNQMDSDSVLVDPVL